MPDYGSQAAEKTVRKIENRIKKVYSKARKDLQKELDEFTRKGCPEKSVAESREDHDLPVR